MDKTNESQTENNTPDKMPVRLRTSEPEVQPPADAGSAVPVSVVIPAYQAAKHIAQALDSVFSQSFTDFEVLLVNDGSPDTEQLEQVLQPYMARLRYIKQANRGPSGARNTAIQQARGKYLAFLDSDDFWLPHHLAYQIARLQANPKLMLVYANSIVLEDNRPIGRAFDTSAPQSGPVTFESLVSETCTVNTSSTVASRQAVLEAGAFDESMKRCEDLDLWLRLCHRGALMNYYRDVQVCHRIRNGLAADRELMKEAHIAVYAKALRMLPLEPQQHAIVQDCMRQVEAGLHVERAKRLLSAGRYSEALAAVRQASTTLDSWKLRMAISGMRHVPLLFRQSYAAYQRILLRTQRHRRSRHLSAKDRVDLEQLGIISSQTDSLHARTSQIKKMQGVIEHSRDDISVQSLRF